MKKGYSLIELLIVLAVATLIIYGAANTFLNRSPKYRLHRATWEIQTRLNYARHRAIFEGQPVRVRFQPTGYMVEKYDEQQKRWQIEVTGSIEGVHIEANNSPTFHPFGTVSNLASITVSNSGGTFRITLAISGRIRVVKL
jgi:prepilin-type N-terminal cleavage/methylation domain-containing protein